MADEVIEVGMDDESEKTEKPPLISCRAPETLKAVITQRSMDESFDKVGRLTVLAQPESGEVLFLALCD